MVRLEDKSRQSNLRLVGLKEGEEGSDPVGYLQAQLPIWIPALRNGRNAILTGARAAGKILHKGNLLHFYPDYSNQTATQRREVNLCRKKLTQIGISSFLIYPSIVKLHLTKFDAEHQELLNRPISPEELKLALDSMSKNKAPATYSWEREDLAKPDWDTVWGNCFTASKNLAHQMIHYKSINKAYLTPSVLYKMRDIVLLECTTAKPNDAKDRTIGSWEEMAEILLDKLKR
ncbi:uncharacterized protein LOC122133667 [Tachysurus ichikawai]